MSFDMQNMWFCKELGYHDSKATRSHVSSSFSSASCQATYEASTNHLSQTVSPTQTFPIEEDPPVHISEDLPDLIDFSQERFPGCSFPRSAPRQITDYRYLTVGMGCPPLRHMHSWAMVPRWTATSYQSFRTEDSPLCHLVLPTSPNWTSFGDFFRQHHCSYLLKPARRHSVQISLQARSWDLGPLHCEPYLPDGKTCSRDREYHSQFPQQSVHQHSQMGVGKRISPTSIQCMGIHRCRCICYQTQCKTQMILHKRGQGYSF